MKQVSLILIVALILSSCTIFRPHKMDIEQGNIILTEKVASLHPGLTINQVKQIMGNPVLVNLFSPQRVDYIYTFQAGYEKMQVKRVICVFVNGVLKDVVVSHNEV